MGDAERLRDVAVEGGRRDDASGLLPREPGTLDPEAWSTRSETCGSLQRAAGRADLLEGARVLDELPLALRPSNAGAGVRIIAEERTPNCGHVRRSSNQDE